MLFIKTVLSKSFDERLTPLPQVLQNRKDFCTSVGIDLSQLVFADQQHGGHIAIVTSQDLDSQYYGSTKITHDGGVDGLITREPGIFLTVLTADCLPIFFYDPAQEVVGIAHAGWKGILNEFPVKMIQAFEKEFGSRKEDIQISIGPSIRVCCYRVDQAPDGRLQKFSEKFGPEVHQNGYVDLQKSLEVQLTRLGILPEQLSLDAACTCCNTDFFSYYREKNNLRGESAHIIGIPKM